MNQYSKTALFLLMGITAALSIFTLSFPEISPNSNQKLTDTRNFQANVLQFQNFFPDVPESHENHIAIEFMKDTQAILGYPDSTFKPEKELNRAELVTIFTRLIHKDEKLNSPATPCFADVPTSEWYTTSVCTAVSDGWIKGYPDGTFQPANILNQVEFLAVVQRLFEWETDNITVTDPRIPPDEWFSQNAQFAADKNLLITAQYDWGSNVTRSQLAETFFRFLVVWNQNNQPYSETLRDTFLNEFYSDPNRDPLNNQNSANNQTPSQSPQTQNPTFGNQTTTDFQDAFENSYLSEIGEITEIETDMPADTVAQAKEIITEYVIKNKPDYEFIVHFWPTTLPKNTLIQPGFIPLKNIGEYTLTEDSWFFFIDEQSNNSMFAHPVRFALVGKDSGILTGIRQFWWPLIDEKYHIFASSESRADTSLWLYPNASQKNDYLPPDNNQPPTTTTTQTTTSNLISSAYAQPTPTVGTGNLCPKANCYCGRAGQKLALSLLGDDESGWKWPFKKGILDYIDNVGFDQHWSYSPMKHVSKNYPDPAAANTDLTFADNLAATPENLVNGLLELAEQADCCDTILIAITAHGGPDGTLSLNPRYMEKITDAKGNITNVNRGHPQGGYISRASLMNLLNNIHSCDQTFFLDACHGGIYAEQSGSESILDLPSGEKLIPENIELSQELYDKIPQPAIGCNCRQFISPLGPTDSAPPSAFIERFFDDLEQGLSTEQAFENASAAQKAEFTSPSNIENHRPYANVVPVGGFTTDQSYCADTDSDGLPNAEETRIGTDPAAADTDGDNIPDGAEKGWPEIFGNPKSVEDARRQSATEPDNRYTSPTEADSDQDGLDDGDEIENDTNPLNPDTDGEGLSDFGEQGSQTDPNNPDTDGDNCTDYEEVYQGYSDPNNVDTDSDGLGDCEEKKYHTDPRKEDTDGDGLVDSVEIKTTKTDPLKPDQY